jgi:1,4-alpha-glucan branching enzyme
VGVPAAGRYRELLCSDAAEFGGAGGKRAASVTAKAKPANQQPYSVTLALPAMSMVCYAVPDVTASAEAAPEKPKRTRKTTKKAETKPE